MEDQSKWAMTTSISQNQIRIANQRFHLIYTIAIGIIPDLEAKVWSINVTSVPRTQRGQRPQFDDLAISKRSNKHSFYSLAN